MVATAPAVTFASLTSVPQNLVFDFEAFIKNDLGFNLDVEKRVLAEICKYYVKGHCAKGAACPFRHQKNEKTVVCKHWLRNLCKKGDLCEFLHEYNMKKMPECWFYTKYGECSNSECLYLHIDPESKVKECAWYARGFCKHGPKCRHKHVRKAPCQNYLTGFCPLGPDCQFGHPKYELPNLSDQPYYHAANVNNQHQQAAAASSTGGDDNASQSSGPTHHGMGRGRGSFNLATVTCFKCGELGHFANHCPNGRRNFAPGSHPNARPIPSFTG